jgi:hypothetical protein
MNLIFHYCLLGKKEKILSKTYQTRWGILQFHLGGPGLPKFDLAETRLAIHETENGTPVKCLSGNDLLESKKKANRPQDQLDIQFLEKKKEAGFFTREDSSNHKTRDKDKKI